MADEGTGSDAGATPEGAPDPTATTGPPPADGNDDGLGDAGKAALAQERTARAEAVRARKVAEKELEQFRRASMSEAEKAVAEAVARGRSEATAAFAERLVRSEYLTAAAKRNPAFDAASVIEELNLARFAGEDGEPDSKAITASVERLIPAPASGPPSFDGGARTTAQKAPDMNDLIRGLGSR